MKKALFPLCVLSAMLYGQTFPPVQTAEQIEAELKFLTANADQVGFTYQGTQGDLNNLTLPLSYYSTADYWGRYVGALAGNDLTVVDVYNPGDYTLTPNLSSPGADLQVERVNVFYGTDIYDAACWQIALGVSGKAGLGGNLFQMAENQDRLLQVGYDGNASQAQANANRATTHQDGTFQYNGVSITNGTNAYFFRMITRNWLSQDPFMGTSYMKYVTAQNLPPNPDYQVGKITWLDWKPITGENAWGFFIGPLQTALLKQQAQGQQYVPFSSTAVQNALGTLYALRCMQSQIGGIYYACKGSLGNQGDQPVNPYEVSVENNASALAGLLIFQQVLTDEVQYESDLSSGQKQQIQTALQQIQEMIHGGAETKGLLSFFQNEAWDADAGIFYQGGLANDPKSTSNWVPTSEPKAVDVSTWGIAVLGQPLIDSWNGFGTAYKMWKSVKSWGGYFGPDGTLWGVGYSDQDAHGIISAEWTAGAINMLRCLITQYSAASGGDAFLQELQSDHDSMYKYLMTLRNDQYVATDAYASVRPDNYASLIPIPEDKLAFLYASKRYMIPFGWYANPLPSTTSTSWALFLHYNFNPFSPKGDYSASF